MSVANVMKKIKSNNVKFVDLRFSDTKGQRTACDCTHLCI